MLTEVVLAEGSLLGLQMVAFAAYLTRRCAERDTHLVFPPFEIYHGAPYPHDLIYP